MDGLDIHGQKTTRKFNELNKGLEFYSKYDRTHDLSIVANYQISKRLNFSTVFVYATGNTLTLPESAFLIDGDLILEWGKEIVIEWNHIID